MSEETRPTENQEPKPQEQTSPEAAGASSPPGQGDLPAAEGASRQTAEQCAEPAADVGRTESAGQAESVGPTEPTGQVDSAAPRLRPRLRLNPKITDPSALKPVPSLGPSAGVRSAGKRRSARGGQQRPTAGDRLAATAASPNVDQQSAPQPPTAAEPPVQQSATEQPAAAPSSTGEPRPPQQPREPQPDASASPPAETGVEKVQGEQREAASGRAEPVSAEQRGAVSASEPSVGESACVSEQQAVAEQVQPVEEGAEPAQPTVGAEPAAAPAGAEATQAVPSADEPPAGPERTDGQEQAAAASAAAAEPSEVELPPKDIELDAELEAEIEAALADGLGEVVPTVSSETAERPVSIDDVPDQGARLKGRIQSIHGEDVFVDLGYRSPGVVSIRQFPSDKPPVVGREVEVVVARFDPTDGLIVCNLPTGVQRLASDWDAVEVGQTVECLVSAVIKGGLEVRVGNLRAFMPASQVDLGYVADLEPFVGQKLKAKIIEADPRRRNMVVSRRELLAEERRQAEAEFWKTVEEGQVLTGRVKKLMEYGAFVDLGPVDGFLHVGQISWTRINHPAEVLSEGQEVEVKVISVEPESKRVGLSLKQLTDNPWATAAERYQKGKVYPGRVTRIADFGAFVELEPGVEGLVHISELTYRRVNRVTDVVQEGQEVDVQVLNVDTVHRRISLSMKAIEEKPPEMKSLAEAQKEAEEARRGEPARPKRKRPLKGGLDSGSGPLFGDPRLFGG